MKHSKYELTDRRLMISVQMLADELDNDFINYESGGRLIEPLFSGCALYAGCRDELSKGILYIVNEENMASFPTDEYPYITRSRLTGNAPHICSVEMGETEMINKVLGIIRKYRDFEADLNRLIFSGGNLDDLCLLGSSFFNNPMYIHDSMFCIISRPVDVRGMLEPEYNSETGKSYIPLWLINDFKFDTDYQNTYKQMHAAIWGLDQYPKQIRSMYVNLWDDGYYMGRLLINEINSSLKPGQFLMAEFFADYIKYIIWRDSRNSNRYYKDFRDTFGGMLRGGEVSQMDWKAFLEIMGWERNDAYICVKARSQKREISTRSEGAFRNALTKMMRGFFVFEHEQETCLIVNLKHAAAGAGDIRSMLSSYIRESFMYCGISNEFRDLFQAAGAFRQTDITLAYIEKNPVRWILTFSDCALTYILDNIKADLRKEMLVAPELLRLIEYDREKDTQYYETYRAYVNNDCSIPKTSEQLIIHRTTLLYRLNKINELTGLNLDSPEVRLYLLISFRLIDEYILP